jgi:hypothetical protein
LSCSKLIVACASALAIAVSATPPAGATGLSLTPNGLGKLRLGMSPKQAQAALGRRMTTISPAFLPGCGYTSVPSLRLAIMFLNLRVARIDVLQSSPVHAMGGIRRGDTEADVRRAYGPKVTETAHTYTNGSYLTVGWRSGPYANRGIRFETDENGTVTSFYAGRHDAIRYVEGCA